MEREMREEGSEMRTMRQWFGRGRGKGGWGGGGRGACVA